jgi:hypothetical protein
VIVNDLYLVRLPISKTETNSPLVVYPNAPLSLSSTFQEFEAISRRTFEISDSFRAINHLQFAFRDNRDGFEPARAIP